MSKKTNYGISVVVTLVALRVLIGVHFFTEGVSKLQDPKPFSAMFFSNAKGPLAPVYRNMVWDGDGLARLNYAVDDDGDPEVNTEATEEVWDAYREQAIRYYGFDENQQAAAADINEKWDRMLREFAADYRSELVEYFHGVRRRDRNREYAAMDGVESLWGQRVKWEKELKSNGAPLIATADALWSSYEQAIFAIATEEQQQRGLLKIRRPGRRFMDSEMVDSFIPYFDAAIGLLLILGLFTRFAAVAGGLFLGSVVLSQFPGATGAMATWPQAIEMIGLFVVAATAAGRFAGLDLFAMPLFKRMFASKKTGSDS